MTYHKYIKKENALIIQYPCHCEHVHCVRFQSPVLYYLHHFSLPRSLSRISFKPPVVVFSHHEVQVILTTKAGSAFTSAKDSAQRCHLVLSIGAPRNDGYFLPNIERCILRRVTSKGTASLFICSECAHCLGVLNMEMSRSFINIERYEFILWSFIDALVLSSYHFLSGQAQGLFKIRKTIMRNEGGGDYFFEIYIFFLLT